MIQKHLILLLLLFGFVHSDIATGADLPNIVVMLADDMGFGEVQHLNPKRGKIATPQLDAIAKGGMVFTDGHSGSSVCTPTRYGLLTGRYAWRTRLQNGVLTGGECLIAEGRLTIASMLRKKGYHTALIGKWHLGMLFDGQKQTGKVPIGTAVTHGPIDRGGFDEFHGFHHARQMNLWIDNDKVTKEITPVEMLPALTDQAVEYIESRKGTDKPFLLYVPWNAPHSPVVPIPQWAGKSGLNAHADFVMQTDDSFGQVFRALKDNGFAENTLVICSADNGTSGPTSKIADLIKLGHYPSGDLRGSKADIWDGGHRVPFLANWANVIKPGSRCDQLICLTDIMATTAEISGSEIPVDAGEDSFSFLPLLRGQKIGSRKDVIHHSISGQFAIREGDWKLSLCAGSGGWSNPKDNQVLKSGGPKWQLYNMNKDLGEQANLFDSESEKADALYKKLVRQVKSGRSNPGEKQANDVEVKIEKATSENKPKKNKKKSGKVS